MYIVRIECRNENVSLSAPCVYGASKGNIKEILQYETKIMSHDLNLKMFVIKRNVLKYFPVQMCLCVRIFYNNFRYDTSFLSFSLFSSFSFIFCLPSKRTSPYYKPICMCMYGIIALVLIWSISIFYVFGKTIYKV